MSETLITDSQDIKAILDNLDINAYADEITGILVDLDVAVNGEIYPGDVKLTDWRSPWSIHAEFRPVEYFADDIPDELDLQDIGECETEVWCVLHQKWVRCNDHHGILCPKCEHEENVGSVT